MQRVQDLAEQERRLRDRVLRNARRCPPSSAARASARRRARGRPRGGARARAACSSAARRRRRSCRRSGRPERGTGSRPRRAHATSRSRSPRRDAFGSFAHGFGSARTPSWNTMTRPVRTSVHETQSAPGRPCFRLSRSVAHGMRSETIRSSGVRSMRPPTACADSLPTPTVRARRVRPSARSGTPTRSAGRIRTTSPSRMPFHVSESGRAANAPAEPGRGGDVGRVDRPDARAAHDVELEAAWELGVDPLEEVREHAGFVRAARPASRKHERRPALRSLHEG